MTVSPKFIAPITGEHVRSALAIARPNVEAFRQEEMAWLQDHNSYLWAATVKRFEKRIHLEGIDNGSAQMAGSVLGHRAVRLCVGEGAEYLRVSDNFRRNLEQDQLRIQTPGPELDLPCWDSQEILNEVFGDPDLVASLLEIKHGVARDAAASIIGFFCLADIPHPRPSVPSDTSATST